SLADLGNPEAQPGFIEPGYAGIEFRPGDDRMIIVVDAAAGEYQGAGVEVDFIMANHHEDLDFLADPVVAQQQDGRCWARSDGLGHGISRPHWIAARDWRAGRSAPPATADSPLQPAPPA